MTSPQILELLKKLLAHEQSARSIGSLEEADAFAKKIQSLCDEYRINLADLSFEDLSQTIGEVRWNWCDAGWRAQTRRCEWWLKLLARGVAEGHECVEVKLIYPKRGMMGFSFVGLRTDASVAAAMFTVLIRSALFAWRKQTDKRLKRNSFLYGFAVAIRTRYGKRRSVKLDENESAQALVRTIDLVIQKYLDRPEISEGAQNTPKQRMNRSMLKGFDAGMATSIESNTLTSSAKRLKAATE